MSARKASFDEAPATPLSTQAVLPSITDPATGDAIDMPGAGDGASGGEQASFFPTVDDPDEADPETARLTNGRMPSYIGEHRKRLRERFMAGGPDAIPDYEMLEMILFRANARQDMKPLAWQLMDRFGDFNRVLSAPPRRLKEVKGVGDAIVFELKLIEAAARRLSRSRVMDRQVISSWGALIDYCHITLTNRETEQFRVLYLDNKNVLIADEAQGEGTVDHVPVYTREVLKRGLDLNACALILVHNHPSGDPTPSQADIDMTRQIESAGAALSITVHDHIIIGKSQEVSFRASGYL